MEECGKNKNNSKNPIVECMGCKRELPLDHSGVKCLQNHNLCADCSKTFINMIFAEPQVYLPAKCPDCRAEILMNTVEMQLDKNDLMKLQHMYLVYTLNENFISKNEVIVSCPFCSYSEIREKHGINFVFCKNETCGKRSCYFCHLECDYEELDFSDDESYLRGNESEYSNAKDHFECALFDPLKKKIEEAIEKGGKVECPNPECRTAGRKDDACTHMTCVKCNTVYCYVCGLSQRDCDKESNIDSIYQHNIGWYENPERCPMYLNAIYEIDERWPDEDTDENDIENACLDFFHRIRILKNLRELITSNEKEIREFEVKTGILAKAGFNIDTIMNEDLTLIARD